MAAKPIVLEIDKIRTAAGSTVIFDNIIPPTTLAGEVLIYNGTNFVTDASFSKTSYVNTQITNIIGGASSTHDTLGKIETQMTSGTGSLVSVTSALITKAPLPAIPTPAGSALTWDGGTFQNDASFAEVTYVDAQVLSLIDSATTYDTIGKLEGAIQINESDISTAQTDITTLQADMLTKAPMPATPTSAGEVLTFVAGAFQNDSSFATQSFVSTEINTLKNDILGGASGAYDTLIEIQNELIGNDSDIASLLTTMATKAPIPTPDTGPAEVLAWRFGTWVNDPSFAQQTWVDTKLLALIGGASTSFDTLGKIETAVLANTADITTNDADIATVQSDILTKAPLPTGTTGVITWDGTAFQNDISYSKTSYVDSEVTKLIGGASANYDTLGKVETLVAANAASISGNQSDISSVQSDIANIQSSISLKAPLPPASAFNEFLQWDVTANGGSGGFINTIVSGGGGGGGGGTSASGVIQVSSNTETGSQALGVDGYSTKSFCTMVMKGNLSHVLFLTSGSAQANGEAQMYVHWRSRNTTSDPWGGYTDSGKILVRIYESYSMSEARDSSIAVHSPNLPVGAEVEYRVYFDIIYGTCYYPEDASVTLKTNMTLLEIAA